MMQRRAASLLAAAGLLAIPFSAWAEEVTVDPAVPAGTSDPFGIMVEAGNNALNPVLAVRLDWPSASGTIEFTPYCNYGAFVKRLEIRVYRTREDRASDTPFAILPIDGNQGVVWSPPPELPEGAGFILRAYGQQGSQDETILHRFERPKRDADSASESGYWVDQAQRRTIPLRGVAVTVRGRAPAMSDRVTVNGVNVPVGRDGLFVSEQILAESKGTVKVAITNDQQTLLLADRHYDAAKRRWFVVGQGDVTLSHAIANGPAAAVSGDPRASGDHVTSRAALYAKGVLARDYRVTASLDTGETLLKDILSNLDRKDPSQLLRRIDERYQYPTFGDSSSYVEDAPSQGQFYLRVQKDDSNLVIGNFITAAQGTELVQLDRGLYGAMLDYKSQALTRNGDRRNQLFLFASDPGTITASDELRGTGGSLFYLRHQDLSIGSERIRIEIRSPQTGAVLASTPLRVTEDYEIDYFQGRVVLLRPLASYLPNDELVRASAASGNVPVLVARYEYTPPQGSISGHSIGGRAYQWLGQWLRLGVTGQSETAAPADQLVLGGDVTVKATANTWLKGEFGRTDGPGFAQSTSLTGGLDFDEIHNSAQAGKIAKAWRVEGALDEADLSPSLRGKAAGYFESYEAGFAAMGRLSPNAMRRWSARLDQALGRDTQLLLAYEGRQDDGIGGTDVARGEWTQALSPDISIRTGLRFEDIRTPVQSTAAHGQRLDGGIQATYARIGARWSAFGFGQVTLSRDSSRESNNRAGAGMKWDLTRSLSAQAEVSEGTGGWATAISMTRKNGVGSESRIGYRLYSDIADRGYNPQELATETSRGVLVVSSQQRLTESLTLVGEEKYGHGGTASSLTHAYGLRFAPDRQWSFNAGVEKSMVFEDPAKNRPGIDRLAATASATYSADALTLSSGVEFRRDQQGAGTQTSWLFRNRVDAKPDPDWHVMGRFEYAFTDVAGASLNAADFTRITGGLAYRPVRNDRLNVLARYTYMRDLGPAGQIMSTGGVEQPKQVSQIASLDLSYDLADWITVGGKYAFRQGKVSITRASDTFVDSAAKLYVGRTDLHLTRNWDFLAEGRLLDTSLTQDRRVGFLAAIYRHLGNGIKLGAGYNFADYSTDLTDQSYSTRGWFLNFLAGL